MHTDYHRESESSGVEPFFQDYSEDGLREQVRWCQRNLGLTDKYYPNMLRIEPQRFDEWQRGKAHLSKAHEEILKAFWRLHLHLRTFYNNDATAIRSMYDHVPPRTYERADPLWSGTSIKSYIETKGGPGIKAVQLWLEGLRVPRLY